MKNHRSGDQDFLVKMGEVSHIGGLSIKGEGGEHWFPLMCGYCSNNALYSVSASFTIFIFLLTPFDT